MRNLLILLLLFPTVAFGMNDVALEAKCDAMGQVSLSIHVQNLDLPGDWKSILVTRREIGSCAPTEIISESWRLPATGEEADYALITQLPEPNRTYRFEMVVRDTDGGLYPIPADSTPSPTTDHVAWGQAICAQGTLESLGGGAYLLVGDESDCWDDVESVTAEDLGVTALQMMVWATRHTAISVYGELEDDPAVGGAFSFVELVKVAPDEEATANTSMSLGRLKASYR